MSNAVKLQNASLDDKGDEIVAHGWLDVEALEHLHVGDYQREVLINREGKKSSIRKAIEANERLPDILLGMRGQKFSERGSSMLLESDVYVIDGLQRVSTLRKFAADFPDKAKALRIGAEVRFSTTRDSEKELFTVVNKQRKSMSPSIILRNERNNSPGVATLYGLSTSDKNSALYGKVCWNQQMDRGELFTALNICKTAQVLHRHLGAGGRHGGTESIPRVLDNMSKVVGLHIFRNNIHTFFEIMDEVWGIRGIKYKDRVTHTRGNFMQQLAIMFSDHEDFWDGQKLALTADQKSKLKRFPIDDPNVIRLSSAGTTSGVILYRYMVDHMNFKRRSHLTPRRIQSPTGNGLSAKYDSAQLAAKTIKVK